MMTPTAPVATRRAGPPGRAAKPTPALSGPSPLEILVGSVLAAIFLYETTFNLVPSSIRLPLAGGLAGGMVLLSLAWILISPRIWRLILFALLLLVASCWLIGEANGGGRLDFAEGIRFLLPLFFALWVIELRRAINPQLLFVLAAGTLIIATFSSILRPQAIIGNVLRLPPFTGGEDGAHASAYVVALCGLLVHQLWLNRSVSKRVAWSFLGLAGVLLIGMRVATPIFMLLNYCLLHILLTKQLGTGNKILLWFTVVASIVAVLFWHEGLQEDMRGSAAASVENLGSGRVGTWLGRLELIARRDLLKLLFGSGIGSDQFYSAIWWWEKKDSHHDFLTIVIESGFIGLMAILFFLFMLFRRLGSDGMPLAWFLLSGSSLSNALLQRPIIATLFWLAVALAALRVDRRLQANWREQQIAYRNRRRRHAAAAKDQPRRPPVPARRVP